MAVDCSEQQEGGIMKIIAWVLAGLVLLAVIIYSNAAFAQSGHAGYTTTGVNMRTGPGTKYPVITTIPAGGVVFINYCTKNGSWCDLTFRGAPGWVSARYIRYGVEGPHYSRTLPYVAPYVGLPFIYRRYPIYPRYPHWRPYPHPRREIPAYPLQPSRPIEVPAVPLTPAQPIAPPVTPSIPLTPAQPIAPPSVPATPLSPAQ